ncbi:hypothetical protein C0J52_24693 [Blattella germanica]|nr:hypothetical protein C0J52_24693 [Blattella germanica]
MCCHYARYTNSRSSVCSSAPYALNSSWWSSFRTHTVTLSQCQKLSHQVKCGTRYVLANSEYTFLDPFV